MKKLVIRYGVFAILAIMFAGIAFITDGLELQDKKAVSIVVGKSGCRIYMDRDGSALPSPGDTLYIVQTRHGDMKFVADTAWAESASAVVRSRIPAPHRVRERMRGDTYSPGYILAGKKKLRHMVMRRIGK